MNKLKDIVVKTSILLGSCAVTLVAFEIALRVVTQRKNIYTIEMVKYAKSLKMADPSGFASHVHRPSSEAHLMGVDIKLNSLGHRSPERSLVKSTNTKRLFLLGSSITMGWGVETPDVFSSVVERELSRKGKSVEIFNAGIGNYNTYYQHQLFNKQFGKINPDMVVLHYFINDAEPNPESSNPLAKYSYLAAYLNSEFQAMYFRYVGGRDLASYYKSLYEPQNPQWQKTQKLIAKMKAKSDENKVPFLVMIVPDTHNLEPGSPYAPIYRSIKQSLNKQNIATLNLFDAFQEKFGTNEPALWVQADDPHPNALGHRLMADELTKYLEKSNLWKSSKETTSHTS